MKKNQEIKWLPEPVAENYPAALSYLSLIYDEETAKKFVSELQAAVVTDFKAKDIFRASSLSLLGVSNSHVKKDQRKIEKGIELSPILLVRDLEYFDREMPKKY